MPSSGPARAPGQPPAWHRWEQLDAAPRPQPRACRTSPKGPATSGFRLPGRLDTRRPRAAADRVGGWPPVPVPRITHLARRVARVAQIVTRSCAAPRRRVTPATTRRAAVLVAKILTPLTVATPCPPTRLPASGAGPRAPGTIGTAGRRRTHRRAARPTPPVQSRCVEMWFQQTPGVWLEHGLKHGEVGDGV